MESKIYPKYIENKPIGEDHFEGKAHDRIAESISEHINNKNSKLRVLGIEGEWGSGKSNIIELLRKKLDKTHHIYIYDAWGHQEDSQRRAFLEELTEDLIDNNKNILSERTRYKDLTGREKNITWKEKIRFLLARKKETNKKTIPKVSGGIIFIGLTIILTPIFALMSDFLGEDDSAIILKILFSVSLLVIAFFVWLFHALWKKFISDDRAWPNLSSIFYFYKGKELENTTLEIFSDLDPSVKEFKEWIRSISLGLVNKELVIVYDNMDRLPPENVKEIWSSIHTFFAEEEYDKINVIIPFDRKHLEKAYTTGDTTNEFINKTFSIIYRVTPPVLTDWKDFFRKKFEEAFSDTENREFPTVLSVFDRSKAKFTPRDIIIFINELVTYKKVWINEIPLRYIALFAINKNSILESPQKNILNNGYLGAASELFAEDNELQSYISALTFNVPIKKASQVLLVRDLELILREKDNSRINDFSKNTHFIDILEEVIQNSEIILAPAVTTLAKLDESIVKGGHVVERLEKIWDILIAKQCSLAFDKLYFEERYKVLLTKSSKPSKIKLLKYLIKGSNDIDSIKGGDHYTFLQTIEKHISKENIDFDHLSFVKDRTVTPDVFFNYLIEANSEYDRYKVKTDPDDLDDYIAKKIPDELDTIPYSVDLSYLEDYSFESTREKIEDLLEENKLTRENFNKILQLYRSVSKERPISKFVTITNLYNLLQAVDEDDKGYFDLIAIRLKYESNYDKDFTAKGWKDNTKDIMNSEDITTIQNVAKIVENYISYGDLLLLTTKWKTPLLSAICRDLSANKYGIQTVNIVKTLQNFKDIVNSINISESDLLRNLDGWSKYAKEKVELDNIENVIPDYSFYTHSISNSLPLTDHINKIARQYLTTPSSETLSSEWGDDDSYFYNTLYIFMKADVLDSLPRKVFSSIKHILKEIMKATIDIPEKDTIWYFFIEKSKKSEIAPTVKDIRDYFFLQAISSLQFIFFEPFFIEFGKMEENPSKVTRTILGKVVEDDDSFNSILLHQEFYIPIVNKAMDDSADFKDYVLTRMENDPDNTELYDFASRIGVKRKKAENDE